MVLMGFGIFILVFFLDSKDSLRYLSFRNLSFFKILYYIMKILISNGRRMPQAQTDVNTN